MESDDRELLIGSLLGAAGGGSLGYLLTSKENRKKRIKNAILSSITGAVIGGTLARSANYYIDYSNRLNRARANIKNGNIEYAASVGQPDLKMPHKIPGRVMMLVYGNNTHSMNLPFGKKWDFPAEHAKLFITADGADGGTLYNYGDGYDAKLKPRGPGLLQCIYVDAAHGHDLKGKSDSEIFDTLMNLDKDPKTGKYFYGNNLRVITRRVDDIRVPMEYAALFNADKNRNSYSVVPGSYNCGSLMRDIWEAAVNDKKSLLYDYLAGGFPSTNAPSVGIDSIYERNY